MEAGPRAAFEGKARLVAGQIDSVGWVVAACVEPFALVMRRNVLTVHTLLLWQPAPAILAAAAAAAVVAVVVVVVVLVVVVVVVLVVVVVSRAVVVVVGKSVVETNGVDPDEKGVEPDPASITHSHRPALNSCSKSNAKH